MTEIRPADVRDLFAVQRLEVACFGPDAWGWFELMLSLLNPSIRLKVVEAGELIGFAIGERDPLGREGLIATLGIHPTHQRRGLGGRLLAEVERRLNTPRFRLAVRVDNAPAITLYERAGYQRVGRLARYYTGGVDGWSMEKTAPPLTKR